jgi:hypothetical protein
MLLSSPFVALIKRSKRLEYILTLEGSAEINEKMTNGHPPIVTIECNSIPPQSGYLRL